MSNDLSGIRGTGTIESISVADPVPGDNFVFTVGAGRLIRLVNIDVLFTAAVGGGSRFVRYTFNDGSKDVGHVLVDTAIVGSDTRHITMWFGGGNGDVNVSQFFFDINHAGDIYLAEGWTISSDTVAIAAADQFSEISLIVESWAVQQ